MGEVNHLTTPSCEMRSLAGWCRLYSKPFSHRVFFHQLECILLSLCLSAVVGIDVELSVFEEDLIHLPGSTKHLFFVFKVEESSYQWSSPTVALPSQ